MSVIRTSKVSTKKHNGYKVHMESFATAFEVAETCDTRMITDSQFHDRKAEGKSGQFDDWHGVKDYDEALDLLRTGYQPIVNEIKTAFKATVNGEQKRFKFENNVHGFAPIVPLALKGVPNSMINATMRPIKAKVIDVYYDATFTWDVTNEKIIETGKRIIEVLVGLEKQGYRFNLYCVQSYADGDGCDMMVVKIKSAEQPMDLRRISFPIAHTGFFRVIGFDWYSKMPNGKYRSGYGTSLSNKFSYAELKEMAVQLFGKNAVMFSGQELLNQGKEYIEEVVTNGKCSDR